jgi:voltage-gated sodium channel
MLGLFYWPHSPHFFKIAVEQKDMLKRLFLNDRFILYLILINVLLLFIGGFGIPSPISIYIDFIEHSFTILFLIEFFFKWNEYGFKNYFSVNWNKFDFALVAISVPSVIAFFMQSTGSDLSFLLVFRAFRIFKAFRFIKFIPGINDLLEGVIRALRASVFVFLVFTIYIFVIGVLSFYLYKDLSPNFFGTPLKSLYSVFKVFTIEGWNAIPDSITKDLGNAETIATNIYFAFILLTGGIFGLSLVNSIFVDAMVSDNNDELEEKIDRLEKKIDKLLQEKENHN